jgi:hypothetical protein
MKYVDLECEHVSVLHYIILYICLRSVFDQTGSSHCFITDQLAHVFFEKKPLDNPVSVQVANGEKINCSHELIAVFGVHKGIPSSQISKSFH